MSATVLAAALPSLWAILSLFYLGAGAAMAAHLGRRGHPFGTAVAALLCWPLLLGILGRGAPSPNTEAAIARDLARAQASAPQDGSGIPAPAPAPIWGPNHARIEACLQSLGEALGDTHADTDAPLRAVAGLERGQLTSLARALHRADHRLARADRLATQTEHHGRKLAAPASPALARALAELRTARAHSQRELEAILDSLLQLRVQIGLHVLAGDAAPVRERLGELEARVAALAELSSMDRDFGASPGSPAAVAGAAS